MMDIIQKAVTLFDSLENGMMIVDEECTVWLWNRWLEINTGIDSELMIGKKLFEFYPEVDYKGFQRKIRTSLRLNTPTFYDASLSNRFITIPRHKITSSRLTTMQLQVTISPYIPEEKKVMIAIQDISDLHELKMTLQQRMKEIADLNGELERDKQIIDANLMIAKTDCGCIMVEATEALLHFFGYEKKELTGLPLSKLFVAERSETEFLLMKEILQKKEKWSGEVEIITKGKEAVWMDTVVSPFVDESGEIVSYTAIFHDITDKKRIELLSVTDPLTKLFNRQKFDEVFAIMLMRRHWRDGYSFGLVIVDVDHFKKVNDSYGHQVGDTVLVAVADALAKTIRTGDIVARWGGEEFVVLLPDVDIQKACFAAEKLRRAIEEMDVPAVGKVTASFGVTVYFENDTQESMMHRSDTALYRAKKNGRNRIESLLK